MSPFDMCECGWTRIQHCATPPHRCTHGGCSCSRFRLSADRENDALEEAISSPEDLEGALINATSGALWPRRVFSPEGLAKALANSREWTPYKP